MQILAAPFLWQHVRPSLKVCEVFCLLPVSKSLICCSGFSPMFFVFISFRQLLKHQLLVTYDCDPGFSCTGVFYPMISASYLAWALLQSNYTVKEYRVTYRMVKLLLCLHFPMFQSSSRQKLGLWRNVHVTVCKSCFRYDVISRQGDWPRSCQGYTFYYLS